MEEKKNKYMKACIVVMSIIIVLLLSAGFVIFYFINNNSARKETSQTNTSKENLIKVLPKTDIHELPNGGIIGEANILGEHINSVLEGYTKDVDYSIDTTSEYTTYSFDNVDYDIGTSASLTLYSENKSDTISMIEYDFFIEKSGGFLHYATLEGLKDKITDTYKAKPLYVWEDETCSYYEYEKDCDLDCIMWNTDDITITLLFTNYNPDTNRTLSLFFDLIK